MFGKIMASISEVKSKAWGIPVLGCNHQEHSQARHAADVTQPAHDMLTRTAAYMSWLHL